MLLIVDDISYEVFLHLAKELGRAGIKVEYATNNIYITPRDTEQKEKAKEVLERKELPYRMVDR